MLSPADKSTSEIIDAFSNAKYVFLDVYVEFGILLSLRFLGLRRSVHLLDSGLVGKYDHPEANGIAERASVWSNLQWLKLVRILGISDHSLPF